MVQLCDGDNDDGDSYDCDSVTELTMVGLGEESRAKSCWQVDQGDSEQWRRSLKTL